MTPTQTDSFVPLTEALSATSGKRTEFKATVLTEPGEIQKFQSTTIPAAVSPAARAANCQPQVTLQRDGNRVTGIRVQCSCGEVIELACNYEQGATVPQPTIAPQAATIPQPEAGKSETGKICKDSGKDLPISASKESKVPKKAGGTSAAKRGST